MKHIKYWIILINLAFNLFSTHLFAKEKMSLSLTVNKQDKFTLQLNEKQKKYELKKIDSKGNVKSMFIQDGLAEKIQSDILNLIWVTNYKDKKSKECNVAGKLSSASASEEATVCFENIKSYNKFKSMSTQLKSLFK